MTAISLGRTRQDQPDAAGEPRFLSLLWAHPRGRIGLLLVLFMTVLAVAGPFIVPWPVDKLDSAGLAANHYQAIGPLTGWDHLLGTDTLGRDQLSRVVSGVRVSLAVAVIAQVVVLLVGVPIGAVAGWLGGRSETLLMRATDVVAAFPQLVFIIMFQVAFVDTPFQRLLDGLFVVFLGIGLLSWVVVARLVRAQVVALKHRSFVEGARAVGVPGWRILRRHVMPNLVGVVVVGISAGIPAAILTESTLSFLGLGIQPPSPSLGSMIWNGTTHLDQFPHLVIVPAVPLLLVLVGFTMLGDGLRDVLDPSTRH